jgi:hypothetical protein
MEYGIINFDMQVTVNSTTRKAHIKILYTELLSTVISNAKQFNLQIGTLSEKYWMHAVVA